MSSADVIRRLRRDGWTRRNTTGSHHHYTHRTKPGVVTVAHPRKDVPVGTLRSIYRQAGWKWGDR
ncbi:MAG: type II toxin-antitoxin system HicA family toxin [Acidobacteria bacterium]|nr:type II toxin-antitoxin system HicA family toxin [Acidobacteriota bacterium]